MKTHYKVLLLAALGWAASLSATHAQAVNKAYFQIDWQLNVPINNPDFAHKLSGWGMNVEGGYLLDRGLVAGLFAGFHTNNQYTGEKTYFLDNGGTVTTDMQQSRFQIPFGALVRYRFESGGVVEPYVAARVGASYARLAGYLSVLEVYDDTWGVYLSPEIGINIFPNPDNRIGIHVGAYYAYGSNQGDILTYKIKGLHDLGVRVGIAF